jgi:glycosyltransferase involved in cell wall biosynthesis
MKIAIIGNSHFGPILTKQLSEFDKNNSYSFYDTNGKKLDKIKFALNLPFTDVVYSLSASISGGGALNLALKFKKRIVQHFIGSDVLSAIEDFKNNKINQELVTRSQYLVVSLWLKDELKEIGIETTLTHHNLFKKFVTVKESNFFSVLTYIPKQNPKFYGIDEFIKLANDFPNIEFKVAGIDSYKNLPSNIKCLGWINMMEELQHSTVFIRNTKHDGFPFSIVEALSLGKIVFFRNYKYPFVNSFKDYNDLKNQFVKIIDDFENNTLKINYEAIEYVKENFNEEKILKGLIKVLRNEK